MTRALRYCDCCAGVANQVGSYTRDNGERCTVAVCSEAHKAQLLARPGVDQLQLTWKPWAPAEAPAPGPEAKKVYSDKSMAPGDW